MQLTFGSLFAGIGGFDLGFERSGMVCKWQVEIDDYATRVLEKHWPGVHRERDIRSCGSHNLDRVDVICGGFPCQPHSLAGKRGGSEDERDLWSEFVRIVEELQPRFMVGENVPGLLSSESGRFFGRVLGDLASIGFDAEWESLSAAGFEAYQIRERVFILAYPNSDRRPAVIASRWKPSQSSREATAEWRGCKPKLERDSSGRFWAMPDADILGVDARFSKPVDGHRLRCLGNAVVPQIAEWIGMRIVESVKAD